MRPIKFRGKRVDNSEWVTGYYIRNEHMGIIKHIIVTDWAQVYANSYKVRPETVGQFTGLHDRNGKEIYEGDVLQGTVEKQSMPGDNILMSEEIKVRCRARWSRYEAMFYFYCRQLNRAISVIDEFFDLEVIGNIYDNPDLTQKD